MIGEGPIYSLNHWKSGKKNLGKEKQKLQKEKRDLIDLRAGTEQSLEQEQARCRQLENFRQLQESQAQENIANAEGRVRDEERALAKRTLDATIAEHEKKCSSLETQCTKGPK